MRSAIVFILLLFHSFVRAQDSLPQPTFTPDTVRETVIKTSFLQCYPKGWFFLQKESAHNGKEQVFYALMLILLIFGILKTKFGRYTTDMFRFYFQSTLRIQQIKEQLTHSVLSGIFYNLLFFLGMSLYLYLLADHFHLSFLTNKYNLLFVVLAIMLVIYGFKYAFIHFLSWAFQEKKAGNIYLFIIFLTNKIMGILLLPFCMGIAFGTPVLKEYSVTLSVSLVVSLFVFRFFRAYQPLKAEFKIGIFQYLLLLISIELAPLLLIYKLLLQHL